MVVGFWSVGWRTQSLYKSQSSFLWEWGRNPTKSGGSSKVVPRDSPNSKLDVDNQAFDAGLSHLQCQ